MRRARQKSEKNQVEEGKPCFRIFFSDIFEKRAQSRRQSDRFLIGEGPIEYRPMLYMTDFWRGNEKKIR